MREKNKKRLKYVLMILSMIYLSNILFNLMTSNVNELEERLPGPENGLLSTEQNSLAVDLIVEKKSKIIGFWTPYSSYEKYSLWKKVFKRLLSGECEESRCRLNLNKSDIEKADAVIFNAGNLRNKRFAKKHSNKYIPEKRNANQFYVYFSMEASQHALKRKKLNDYRDFFNWTMTYRKDSDVYVPYGQVFKRKIRAEVKYVTDDELKKKKMAFWMVSHCPTPSKREDFAKELSRFVQLDIYGACGTKTCGTKNVLPLINKIDDDPCAALTGNYSFYMALENAFCRDYVTEKFFRSLKLGIIPVVYGAANYKSIAPPHSFIDYKDFQSVAELAQYMIKVSNNASLYNEYFKWKEEYDVELGSPYKPLICDLCKKLHDDSANRHRKTYPSIEKWLAVDGKC